MIDRRPTLLTCPDCGGILQASRPAWTATIEFASDVEPAEAAPTTWLCPICGYHEQAAAPAGTAVQARPGC